MKPTCRVCNTELCDKVFHMANMPLTDDFIAATAQGKFEYLRDIRIYRCDHCGITQNPDDFDHQTYYQDYQYSTGHSEFTKRFMEAYAAATFDAFKKTNGRTAKSVLEVGSGDGQQLMSFRPLGAETLLGIEPSKHLAEIANSNGINTLIDLFDTGMISRISSPVDICISSYTFDHVRQPLDYLKAAHSLLIEGGILALEIHDFGKIVERTEYCLFEHEHTIYLDGNDVEKLLETNGFTVLSLNPLHNSLTRGNSLVIIAKKSGENNITKPDYFADKKTSLNDLQHRITSTVERIDRWIRELPEPATLVGFGAGGRGIMTVAALKEYGRIEALLDSNYQSNKLLAPKTRIPIVGPGEWSKYRDAYCIVFSFGYYQEILESLAKDGFKKNRIVSLFDFYPTSHQ